MPKSPKHSSFAPLVSIAQRGRPFTDPDGQAFVRFESPCSDGYYILPVRSREYRNWFFAQCFAEYETIPSSHAFNSILQHLEAQADADPDFRRFNVFRRVGARGPGYFPHQILLDLANPECQFVEISPTGWRTTAGRNALLQTSRSTSPLPAPEPPPADAPPGPASEASPAPAALEALRSFLNVSSRADWLRCLAWLLSALRPNGPFPPLILQGPPGSGKTWAARLLRFLIDPCTALLTPIPSSVRELLSLARHNWILAFDHISALSPNLTDALCRLSAGVGVAVRETGAPTSDPLLQSFKRPMLLTVTDRFSCPSDLLERALTVTFSPLPPENRSTEAALGTAFIQAQPAILAALCTAVSTALRRLPEMNLPSGRSADALAWAMAAAPALGCTEEEMRQAFSDLPPLHPTAEAVRTLIQQRGPFTGTATELLDLLPPEIPCSLPKGLSQQLRSNALALADAGIELQFRASRDRRVIDLRCTHPRGTGILACVGFSSPAPGVGQVGNLQADCQSAFSPRPTLPTVGIDLPGCDASSPAPSPDASQNPTLPSQTTENKKPETPPKNADAPAHLRPKGVAPQVDASRAAPPVIAPAPSRSPALIPQIPRRAPALAHLTTLAPRPYDEISPESFAAPTSEVRPCAKK